MKKLGRFEIRGSSKELRIKIKDLKIGINDLRNHIIYKEKEDKIKYVINKVCDHAGGRLIVKGEQAVCPMHDWRLNLNSLKYNNSHECKEKLSYQVVDNELLIEDHNRILVNPFRPNKEGECTIRWLNHAAVIIECNGISIMTDPWLFGPAFLTGWWLLKPSPEESIKLLKEVDYIYVSHNHPDHLHAETLSIVSKDIPIITANFKTGSSEKFLRKLGFTNIIAAEFLDIFELDKGFQFSLLKSGDFRDDSGIYLCANGHEILLTVDSNYLNGHVLPQNIDLLMTSFAGGASGFPLCYTNYTEDEKLNVLKRNRSALKTSVIGYIGATIPSYYMPYAGMFSESAGRDKYIKDRNIKNTYKEYENLLKKSAVKIIEPVSNKVIKFQNGELSSATLKTTLLQEEDYNFYINNLKEEYPYNPELILNYLRNSGYKGNQLLQIVPTDDFFHEIVDKIVYADFRNHTFEIRNKESLIDKLYGCRVMQLYVRPEIIMCVVYNYLPWEDFSIGFQMRAKREPNEYESDFWYHFTNIYIAKENFRYSSYCGACTVVNQNPIWIKEDTDQMKSLLKN